MCPTFFLSLVTWYRRAGTTTNTLVCSTEYLVGHNYNIYNKTWTHNEFHFWFKQKKTRFYSNLFMCANCNVFLKNKKYYSLANCKCFCNLWSHYAQLKTYFIFGIFHVPSPIKLSHKCMASIFNYRLLFTLCATVWPCNLNFNIQLMVRFHFFIKLYCSHLYGIYTLDR